MKHYKLTNKYFEDINEILLDINNKLVNNKLNINISLELVDKNHKDFNTMSNKILNCGEGFYNSTNDFYKNFIHIISIKSYNDIIGFITFEDIDDFSDLDKEVLNLVSFYIDKEFRHKQIATKILFSFILYNYENNISLVISEPNQNMGGIIRNSVYNLITMLNNGSIVLETSINDFIENLSSVGIMIKINYFGMQRFESGNCKLVNNQFEYTKYQFERKLSNEESINIGCGGYITSYDKCLEENYECFPTNVLYYIIQKEKGL